MIYQFFMSMVISSLFQNFAPNSMHSTWALYISSIFLPNIKGNQNSFFNLISNVVIY